MKKVQQIVLLLCCVPLAAAAQQPPKAPSPQLRIAELRVQVAQLTAQVHELRLEVSLYEKALGISDQRAADQKQVQDALKALDEAQQEQKAKPR